jgi:cellulose synthase/poly-beta-1,6-N-acetylglucosamine synthase-like glycosyltransferase
VLHRYLLRNRWLAGGVFLVLTVVFYAGGHFPVYWLGGGVCAVSLLYLLTRYGLLTLIAALVSMELLVAFPVTADLAAGQWNASLFALVAVAALGVYGFSISTGGRLLFSDRLA